MRRRFLIAIATCVVGTLVWHASSADVHSGPVLEWLRDRFGMRPVYVAPVYATPGYGVASPGYAAPSYRVPTTTYRVPVGTWPAAAPTATYRPFGGSVVRPRVAYSPITAANPILSPTTPAVPQTVTVLSPAVAAPAWTRTYRPVTSYRTRLLRVPVTYYQPLATTDPLTGSVVTTMQPCTTYRWQVRRVPTVFYRPVYAPAAVQYPALPPTVKSCPPVSSPVTAQPYYTPNPGTITVPPAGVAPPTGPGGTVPADRQPAIGPNEGNRPPGNASRIRRLDDPTRAATTNNSVTRNSATNSPVANSPVANSPVANKPAISDRTPSTTNPPAPVRRPAHGLQPVPDPDAAPNDDSPAAPALLDPRDKTAMNFYTTPRMFTTVSWAKAPEPRDDTMVPVKRVPVKRVPVKHPAAAKPLKLDDGGWTSIRN